MLNHIFQQAVLVHRFANNYTNHLPVFPIAQVKNTARFPADCLEKIQAAFADFKKEALQRKKTVKTGTDSPKEFTDWLHQQSNIIVELTEY